MNHMLTPWVILAALVAAAGCSNETGALREQLRSAQTAHAELRSRHETLQQELQLMKAQVEANTKSTSRENASARSEAAELKKEWSAFQQSFSPELREQLRANLETARKTGTSIEAAQQSATTMLATLKRLLAEAERLKALCAKHAAEAKNLDEIGKLQESTQRMHAAVTALQSKLSQVESESRRATREASDALSRARSAESAARSAESTARSAESAARQAQSRRR